MRDELARLAGHGAHALVVLAVVGASSLLALGPTQSGGAHLARHLVADEMARDIGAQLVGNTRGPVPRVLRRTGFVGHRHFFFVSSFLPCFFFN